MAAPAVKRPPVRKTQAQLDAEQAARVAALAIDPAKAEINAAVQAAETQRIARARATEGVTRALGELTAGDAAALRDSYAGAAERLGQYGAGLTGRLRDLQNTSASSASDLIGRLGLGGGVTSGADANANVTQMLGVAIPGEGLAAAAPRALALGQAHRLAAGARLADNYSLEDYKAGESIAGIRAKLQEIEAKRPGLIMEALNDIRQQANAKRATDVQIGYLQLQQAKTVEDRARALTNLSGSLHVVVGSGKKARVVDTGRPAPGSDAMVEATKAETSRLNAAERAAVAREATAQRERSQARAEAGRNARAKAAAAATKEAAKIKAQQAAGKPPTVSQKNTVINGANASGTTVVNDFADRVWEQIPGTEAKAKDEKPADYNKRIARASTIYKMRLRQQTPRMIALVVATITPNLTLIKYTPAEIRQVAARIVGSLTGQAAPGGR